MFLRSPMPFGGAVASKRVIPVISFEAVETQQLPGIALDRMCRRPNFNRAPRGWGTDYCPESNELWRQADRLKEAKDWNAGLCSLLSSYKNEPSVNPKAPQGRRRKKYLRMIYKVVFYCWVDWWAEANSQVHYTLSQIQDNAATGWSVLPIVPVCHLEQYLIPSVSQCLPALSFPFTLQLYIFSINQKLAYAVIQVMMNNAHRDDGWKKLAVLMTNENNIQRKPYNKVSHYAVGYSDDVK